MFSIAMHFSSQASDVLTSARASSGVATAVVTRAAESFHRLIQAQRFQYP